MNQNIDNFLSIGLLVLVVKVPSTIGGPLLRSNPYSKKVNQSTPGNQIGLVTNQDVESSNLTDGHLKDNKELTADNTDPGPLAKFSPSFRGEQNFQNDSLQLYDSMLPPYVIEPSSFNQLYLNYFNTQPHRVTRSESYSDYEHPVFQNYFSPNDFTKDEIKEYLNFDQWRAMVNDSNQKRKKRSIAMKKFSDDLGLFPGMRTVSSFSKNNSDSRLENRFDQLYQEITNDINEIAKLQAEEKEQETYKLHSGNNKRNAPSNNKICCNPEKPSIILDSASNPSQVEHIDRNTIEEIIQVDIPKKDSKECYQNEKSEERGKRQAWS